MVCINFSFEDRIGRVSDGVYGDELTTHIFARGEVWMVGEDELLLLAGLLTAPDRPDPLGEGEARLGEGVELVRGRDVVAR